MIIRKPTTYKEYTELYSDDLIRTIRNILKKTEDKKLYDFDGSTEHGYFVDFFNEYRLHKKMTMKGFEEWQSKLVLE